MSGNPVNPENLDEALRAVWPGLKAYVVSLLGGRRDHADDVLQETALFIWNNRATIAGVQNFEGWAFRIAYFKAQSKRRDLARDRHTVFSEALFEKLAEEAESAFKSDGETRLRALDACVGKVSADDRSILVWCYVDNKPLTELARRLGRSSDAVHQKISRIRRALRVCLENRLAGGGDASLPRSDTLSPA